MAGKYDPIEKEGEGMACEPLGGSAALIALMGKREGRLIPTAKLLDCIYEDLGWK